MINASMGDGDTHQHTHSLRMANLSEDMLKMCGKDGHCHRICFRILRSRPLHSAVCMQSITVYRSTPLVILQEHQIVTKDKAKKL